MAQALQVGQHIGATGRFGEMNLDDDFAGGIRLLGIVGVAAGVHRHGLFGMRARRAHARLATRRADGRSRPGAQQGSCSLVGKWLCILRRTRRSCHQLKPSTSSISKTPRAISPICKSLM